MGNASYQELETRFLKFLKNVSLEDIRDLEDRDRMIFLGRYYGRNAARLSWDERVYMEVVELLVKRQPNVSERTLGSYLQRSMIALFDDAVVSEDADPEQDAHLDSVLSVLDSERVRAELAKLVETLESKIQEHTVYVPLLGVELRLAELDLGRFKLYPAYAKPIEELKQYASIVHALDDAEEAGSRVWLVMNQVEGESRYVTEQAYALGQGAVQILNLYLSSCKHRLGDYQKISLVGKSAYTQSRIVVYVSPTSVGTSLQKSPVYHEVKQNHISTWKDYGLEEVVRCFGIESPKGKSIEARIVRAVQWYGKAINAESIDEMFVGLAIALESLLVGDGEGGKTEGWGSITQKLAERVAFLLGENYEQREYLEKRIKELYGVRSKIVHQGRTTSKENLFELDDIAKNAMFSFVKGKLRDWYSDWETFKEWVRKLKYEVRVHNPWSELPDTAPFVLEDDEKIIDCHNRKAKKDNKDYLIVHLDLLPEPYLGKPEAPVVLLNLNPGFSEDDHNLYQNNKFAQLCRDNLRHQSNEGYAFYLLNPQLKNESGAKWWYKRLRTLIEKCGQDRVANNVLCVEFFPYHTEHYPNISVPSQRYSWELVRRAMEREAIIVQMRSQALWFQCLPELQMIGTP